jgi:hypothetical protein
VITEPTPTGTESLSDRAMPPVCVSSVIAIDRESDDLAAPPIGPREVDQ